MDDTEKTPLNTGFKGVLSEPAMSWVLEVLGPPSNLTFNRLCIGDYEVCSNPEFEDAFESSLQFKTL